MTYFLGIDVSTTATKALLIDETGDVAAMATTAYPFETPRPLWSEQHPRLWWDGATRSVRQALQQAGIRGSQVGAVGLTGQMHGLVLLDEAGEVLRPAILWNDQRTAAECDEIRRLIGKERLIQITGNDALTGFTAPKILWVKHNEPQLYRQTRHMLLPKDYLRFRLTGDYAVDRAGGSGTLLFDLAARTWSDEMIAALDLDPAWLAPTFEGPAITGTVSQAATEATGLAPGTPVVGGAGDQAAQAVGVGAVDPGIVALTLGTSGVVFAATSEPIVEPQGRLHAFCHAVPARWHLMGVMLSAAGSLRWYRDVMAPGVDFGELVAEAESVPAGSEGLLFLPYLTGERTPYPDPLARGAFVGLTVRHSRPHVTRAVLEGVAFGLRDSLELIRAARQVEREQQTAEGGPRNDLRSQPSAFGTPRSSPQVRLSGGGARSALWRQILSDVLQTELVRVNTTEGAAFGAALLASVGAGFYDDVASAVKATIKVTDRIVPTGEPGAYDGAYGIYRDLYAALQDKFRRLAESSL
jgi:xylulokinase